MPQEHNGICSFSYDVTYFIPDTAHRANVISGRAELGAQSTDMNVHRAGLADKIGTPDGGKKLFPREHPPGVFKEEL